MIHKKQPCPVCHRPIAVRENGRLYVHRRFSALHVERIVCAGSNKLVADWLVLR